jgi:hypothetical protein
MSVHWGAQRSIRAAPAARTDADFPPSENLHENFALAKFLSSPATTPPKQLFIE